VNNDVHFSADAPERHVGVSPSAHVDETGDQRDPWASRREGSREADASCAGDPTADELDGLVAAFGGGPDVHGKRSSDQYHRSSVCHH
jgi:hypothetical protein